MGRLRWASVFLHLRSVSGYCYLVTNAFIEAKPVLGHWRSYRACRAPMAAGRR